jgi:hypothetical protein
MYSSQHQTVAELRKHGRRFRLRSPQAQNKVRSPGATTMPKSRIWIIALLMTVVIEGCKDRNPPPKTATVADNVTNKWLGKWIGPEGTYLVLSKNAEKYVVEINSLDGPATYNGASAGDRIEFQRNGKTEYIHAGNGRDTGMKWLLEKSNCLIIKTGEGFCRD